MADVSFTGVGGTINLHAPEFGDSETYQFKRSVRKTVGGDLKSLYNTDRQNLSRLSLTFRWLTSTEVSSLKTFILANLGKLVTYVDHRGTSWSVIILTPFNGWVTEGLGDCSHNMSLELQLC